MQQQNPKKADGIDVQMADAVTLALTVLQSPTPNLVTLARAINQANSCFSQWGLISDELQQHMDCLRRAGAIACKPTGSGGGGHVVSLWPLKADTSQITWPLIPLPIHTLTHPKPQSRVSSY